MDSVKPNTVYVFAVPPAEEKTEDFLNRLAGLCKYALNQRGGKATIHELVGAMASRERAVQIGLEWLAAGGQLTVNIEEDKVTMTNERQEKNPYLQAELFVALRGVLKETAAYREYFQKAGELKKFFDT